MKVIIQRVLSAAVTVDSQVVSSIGKGILVFVAVAPDDTPKEVEYIANRILKLKLWDSEDGSRWKMSVVDMDHQLLLVSQFTLLAKIKKGSKPDFHGACPPALAKDIYTSLLHKTRELYAKEKELTQENKNVRVQDGVFGAMMQVALVNDGPVTFEVSTASKDKMGTADGVAEPLDGQTQKKVHNMRGRPNDVATDGK
ncbi:D-tyrosyl-tRNA(Tyr) deacylase [Maublancomyces gigas]|uniref:D-aminoacyl-tRNA deacylase n=1 Tax=Discina gigas TaxID=1032678 RepID=A0ABR3G7B5_9PEZI